MIFCKPLLLVNFLLVCDVRSVLVLEMKYFFTLFDDLHAIRVKELSINSKKISPSIDHIYFRKQTPVKLIYQHFFFRVIDSPFKAIQILPIKHFC